MDDIYILYIYMIDHIIVTYPHYICLGLHNGSRILDGQAQQEKRELLAKQLISDVRTSLFLAVANFPVVVNQWIWCSYPLVNKHRP